MPKTSAKRNRPQRGEIWLVKFNNPPTAPTPPDGTPNARLPTIGDEIYKERPAVILSIESHWERRLHIVVPLTKWKPSFVESRYFWMIEIPKDNRNKLNYNSAADTRQIKSVSIERFGNRPIGVMSPGQLDLIAETVAFLVGYSPPRKTGL